MRNKALTIVVANLVILGNILSNSAECQNVDYNKVILPDDAENITFEERLVQLAWKNYPANNAVYEKLKIAKYNVNLANVNWLNKITATGNLNEFNINPSSNPNSNNFYPRYNIGITIPLGIISTTKAEVKTAKSNYEIVEDQIDEMKLIVRSEVLTAYEEYLRSKSIYEIQTQTTELYETAFSLTKSQFLSDEASFEDYNKALVTLNEEKLKSTTAASDFQKSKIFLERLIGVPLNEVRN